MVNIPPICGDFGDGLWHCFTHITQCWSQPSARRRCTTKVWSQLWRPKQRLTFLIGNAGHVRPNTFSKSVYWLTFFRRWPQIMYGKPTNKPSPSYHYEWYCKDNPLVGLLLGSPQFVYGRVSDVDPATSPFGQPAKRRFVGRGIISCMCQHSIHQNPKYWWPKSWWPERNALLWECVLKEKSVGNHRKSLFLGGKTHGFPPDFCKDIGVVVAFRIPDVPGITSGLVYKTEVQAQGKQRWDMEDAWHLEMGNELQVWLSMTFHIFPQSFIMLYQDCSTWYSRSSCSSNLFHNSQFSCAIWNQNVNQNVCRRRSILQFGFVWK